MRCIRKFLGKISYDSSINFLSDEMTFKLTGKEGTYNAWMTSEIRKGNQDALKTAFSTFNL